VQLSVRATNATAYQWRKNGNNVSDGSGGTTANYITAALTAGATYSVVVANGSCSVASNSAVVSIKTEGCTNSCTFTQPAVVGTFVNFNKNYSSSTYVTLTDERDSKNYTVVKIGGRWIMAQNLNYQKGLNWRANSNQPSTGQGQNTALIGYFWCPGSGSSSSSATCNLYGALYSWETTMSFDGKGAWTEASTYCTGAANTTNCKINHGRTSSGSGTGGRGICPPNWHVPTEFEWGVILDGMESGGGTAHQSVIGNNWVGTNAGTRGKAKCSGTASDTNPVWSGSGGTDNYGFRVLPAGSRYYGGSTFNQRGTHAFFWSSSAGSGTCAWYRQFDYLHAAVEQYCNARDLGLSVRCIRD
jgi:uncharacterized protein (TIGR02145 family)